MHKKDAKNKNILQQKKRANERGNIFFTLFGAVAVVGVLGAGIMATMRGPLSTMVEVQHRAEADAEMSIAGKLVLLEATESLANDGDCDSDGFVEPLEYLDAAPQPAGGGQLPASVGSNKEDPWGVNYGYCAWDAGPTIDDAGCGGASQDRLDGTEDTTETYTVIAVISAGPDKTFQTTCTGGATPSITKSAGSDDIWKTYNYQDATVASAGLWSIKSGTPTTATISKDLEVTGGATFTDDLNLTNASAQLVLGAASLILPTDATLITCNAANNNLLRVLVGSQPTDLPIVQICDGDGTNDNWVSATHGANLWKENGTEIYYNTNNVGIGLTDPTEALDVFGNFNLSGGADIGGNIEMANTNSVVWDSGADITEASGALEIDANGGTGVELDVDANDITIIADVDITGSTTDNSAVALDVKDSSSGSLLYVRNDGNVGIGTATPDQELDVNGTGVFSNRVGIGISAPNYDLEIQNYDTGVLIASNYLFSLRNDETGNDTGAGILWNLGSDDRVGLRGGITGAEGGYLQFATENTSGTFAERMRLTSQGLLGIGITNPDDALDVSGDIQGTGSITAGSTIVAGSTVTAGVTTHGDNAFIIDDGSTSVVFGPAEASCTSAQKLKWTDSSGWSCIADLGSGTGSGGGQTLEEILTEGNDAGGLSAEDFGSIGADSYCDAGLGGCVDAADLRDATEIRGELIKATIASDTSTTGQVLSWDQGNLYWEAQTLSELGVNDLGLDSSINSAACSSGYVPISDGISDWVCGDASTIGGTPVMGIDDLTDAKKDTTNNNLFIAHEGGSAGDNNDYNTAVGIGALDALNNDATAGYGDYNAAFGHQALTTNTTGYSNTAVGAVALQLNTAGYYNTAMGHNALRNNTVGYANTAYGSTALNTNVAKTGNTAIGYNALAYADSDATPATTYNTAVGFSALQGSTTAADNTGIQNTALGGLSLLSNTTGQRNTASGTNAMYFNTTGSYNTANGAAALYYNTTGSNNTAVGRYAGLGVMTASNISNNVLFGFEAGVALLTGGDDNTLLGYQAGDSITTGARNIIIGSGVDIDVATNSDYLNIGNALFGEMGDTTSQVDGGADFTIDGNLNVTGDITSGTFTLNFPIDVEGETDIMDLSTSTATFMRHIQADRSIAFGEDAGAALDDVNDATDNVLIGYQAGTAITTGIDNTVFGSTAGVSLTTESANAIFGKDAGQYATADNNTLIGYQAGKAGSGTELTGTDNTFVGYQAGLVNTSGASNTFIGDSAGIAASTGGFNTLLGSATGASLDTEVSNILIGYGIDTDNTDEYLNIGNALFGDMGDTTSQVDGGADLTVDGDLTVTGTIAAGDFAVDKIYEGDTAVETVDAGDGYITFTEDGAEYMRITGGNVGIGTTTPGGVSGAKVLSIDGGAGAAGITFESSSGNFADFIIGANLRFGLKAGSDFNIGVIDNLADSTVNNYLFHVNTTSNNIGIGTGTPDTSSILDLTSTSLGFLPPRMTSAQVAAISSPAEGLLVYDTDLSRYKAYQGGGWYQILTNEVALNIPDDSLDFDKFKDAMALDASTSITADGTEVLSIVNTGTGNSFLVEDESSDTTPFVIDAAGNVGIGTSSPAWNATIHGGASSSYLHFTNDTTGTTTVDGSLIGIDSTGVLQIRQRENLSLRFVTNETEHMRILATGEVGIGTSGPDRTLDVLDAANPQLRLTYTDGSVYTDFQTDSSGYLNILPSGVRTKWGTQSLYSGPSANSSTFSANGRGLLVDAAVASQSDVHILTLKNSGHTPTSGASGGLQITDGFGPTSGTATYEGIGLTATINQTGGANGITRGLYINPTLTAAADWRAVDIANNSGYGIYQSGASATNYFAGNMGIGTTLPGSELDVKGTLRLSGATSGYVGFAPAAVAGSTTYTLPAADGSSGNALITNGSGTLSWGSSSVAADSIDFDDIVDNMTLDASTDINAPSGQAYVLSITNEGTGNSFVVNDVAADTTPFVIDTDGNVGVGISTPSYTLDVLSGANVAANIEGDAGGGVYIGALDSSYGGVWSNQVTPNSTNFALVSNGAATAINGTSSVFLQISNGNKVTLNSSGDVGIGTTSPSSLLDLQESGTAKANTDIFEITNSGNAADMDGTESSILFNQYYYDAGTPAVADAARITVGTETDWTSTIGTQDSYMAFVTGLNGTLAEAMRIDSAGNVGIGTTSPGTKLNLESGTVGGDTALLRFDGDDATIDLRANIGWGPDFLIGTGAIGSLQFDITDNSANTTPTFYFKTAPAIFDGNVGMGTTTPGSKLDVKGTLRLSGATSGYVGFAPAAVAGSTTYTLPASDGTAGHQLTTDGSGNLSWSAAAAVTNIDKITEGDTVVETVDAGDGYITLTEDGTEYLRLTGGNVGIGTSNPTGRIDVRGNPDVGPYAPAIVVGSDTSPANWARLDFKNHNAAQPAILYQDNSGLFTIRTDAAYPIAFLTNGANERLRITANGNVGIGTSSPDSKLGIYAGSLGTTSGNALNLINVGGGTGGNFRGLMAKLIRNSDGNDWITSTMRLQNIIDVTNSAYIDFSPNGTHDLLFGTGSTPTEKMRITADGNVGIGTTSPSTELDVNGKIGINGTQMLYYPEGNFTGTLVIGNGGGALSYASGDHGKYNTFIGIGPGTSNTTGHNNTAYGYLALAANTTGYSNTANGFLALRSNTTGSNNTANGYQALSANTTGAVNTAIGHAALLSNTTANYNTAIGVNALRLNTTGGWNTANGDAALYSNTTGYANTAIGHAALYSNTTANYNTAIGVNALRLNTTGGWNTANGGFAGRYIANGSTGNATGSNSVFLGYNTKANADGETNQIVIGYDATGAGSNSVVLGNDSITKTLLKGNVGIVTTSPGSELDVKGTLRLSGSSSGYVGFAPAAAAGSTTYTLPAADGTAGYQLTTNGSGTLSWTAAAGGGATDIDGLSDAAYDTATAFNMFLGHEGGSVGATDLYNIGIGQGALDALDNSGGTNNTVVGYNAGTSITSGDNNLIAGSGAGLSLLSGSNNIFFGRGAGADNTSGAGNIFIGVSAGEAADIGTNNILIGNGVGTGIAGESRNILIGASVDTDTSDDYLNIANFLYGDMGTTTSTGTGDADVTIDGDLNVDNLNYSGAMIDTSDRRLKTDIHALEQEKMLQKIMDINTYSFRMKNDKNGYIEFGVMAQELENIFPELVYTADDEIQTKSVAYLGLIAPMIEAIQVLEEERSILAAQNRELAESIESIRNDMATLNVIEPAGGDSGNGTFLNLMMMLFAGMFGGVVVMFASRKQKET